MALKAPPSAHWSLWGVDDVSTQICSATVIAWERVLLKMAKWCWGTSTGYGIVRNRRCLGQALSSPHLPDHILNHEEAFSENQHFKSHPICKVFPHNILRFQVKGVQRMQWGNGNGHQIYEKRKIIHHTFPSQHFSVGGKS